MFRLLYQSPHHAKPLQTSIKKKTSHHFRPNVVVISHTSQHFIAHHHYHVSFSPVVTVMFITLHQKLV